MRNNSFLFLAVLLIASCVNKNDSRLLVQIDETVPGVIPVGVALDSLDAFVSVIEGNPTKSNQRSITSIDALSNHRHVSSGVTEPDAYLVNYDNGQGFAILGATAGVAPVIAFVEEGNTTWEAILQSGERTDAVNPEQILLRCVNGALYGHTEEKDTCKVEIPRSGPLTSNLKFGQSRTYCLNASHSFVVCGCAATALAIAVAHNDYPTMYVDYELLDMSDTNTSDGLGILYSFSNNQDIYVQPDDYFSNPLSIPSSLTDAQKISLLQKIDATVTLFHGTPTLYDSLMVFPRTRFKLTSSLFYLLSNALETWGATGTLPDAVETGLEDLGYVNVNQLQGTTLTSGVILDIIDMIADETPAIMCGWSLFSLDNSHYWIVDGVAGSVVNAKIHCNWGWGGPCNGWFSRDCIRPTAGNPYDTGSYGTITTGNDWDNIIVFTYDMQNTVPTVSVHDLYDNKVNY